MAYYGRPSKYAHLEQCLAYAVYSLCDASGDALYVGVTCRFRERLYTHARERAWWSEVDTSRVAAEWFDDKAEANDREAELIELMQPKYNVAGVTRTRNSYGGRMGSKYTRIWGRA